MHLLIAQGLASGVALGLALVVPTPGGAEIIKVAATAAKEIGPFSGKAYREVEATMEGMASGGPYSGPSRWPSQRTRPTITGSRWWTS